VYAISRLLQHHRQSKNAVQCYEDIVLRMAIRQLVYIWHRQALIELHLPALRLHGSHSLVLTQLAGLVIADQHKVVRDGLAALLDAVLLRLLRSHCSEVNEQTLLDAEDGIGCLVRVAAEVEGTVRVSDCRMCRGKGELT